MQLNDTPTAEHTAPILFPPQQSQHYINFAATFKLPRAFTALLVQNKICVKCIQESFSWFMLSSCNKDGISSSTQSLFVFLSLLTVF